MENKDKKKEEPPKVQKQESAKKPVSPPKKEEAKVEKAVAPLDLTKEEDEILNKTAKIDPVVVKEPITQKASPQISKDTQEGQQDSTIVKPLNTLEVNNSLAESSMIEDANDKKPLIDVEKPTKVMLSEASDTADDAPEQQQRNPDALSSFADFYSRKRPSKNLKHKKQIAYDALHGIVPDFQGHAKVEGDAGDQGADCHNYAEYKSLKYEHVRTILKEQDYVDLSDQSISVGPKGFMDRFIIGRDNKAYNLGMICVSVISMVSSMQSLYYAAFQIKITAESLEVGHPYRRSNEFYITCEFFFVVDVILMFFHEQKDPETFKPIRDMYTIAMTYLKGNFAYDVISLIPFYMLRFNNVDDGSGFKTYYDYYCLLYLLKLLRMKKSVQIFSPKYFSDIIKITFNSGRKEKIRKVELQGGFFDPYTDYNQILEQLRIVYVFKVLRMAVIILLLSYVVGIAWFIFISMEVDFFRAYQGSDREKEHQELGYVFDDEDGPANFITLYGMVSLNDPDQWKKHFHNCLSVTYFSLTTLSTIGFGDFHPKSNVERFIIAFVLLFGVMVFSLIMGIFMEIVDKLQELGRDNEDADGLSRFMGMLTKYNNGRLIKPKLKNGLEDFFEFYWANDKMSWCQSEEDMRYIDELPEHVQVEIYKGFLYRTFMKTFRKFFDFPKNKRKGSVFKWIDEEYSLYMIQLLRNLEPRRYQPGEVLHDELDEILEITFIQHGSVLCGYQLNKVNKMKLHFPPGTVIGGFNCLFFQKSSFIYRCKIEIQAYALKKKPLMELDQAFPELYLQMKRRFFRIYMDDIRKPLMLEKEQDMAALEYRSDFTQILSIAMKGQQGQNTNFIEEIEKELFETSSEEEETVEKNEDGTTTRTKKGKEFVRIEFMESKIEAVERLALNIIKTGENKYLEAMGQPPIIYDNSPIHIARPPSKNRGADKKKGTKSQKGDDLRENSKTLLQDDDDHLD